MIVRELIHIIGFRINESQYASVEARVRQLGSMMSFITTVPIVLLGKSFLEASLNMDTLAMSIETYAKNAEEAAKVTEDLKTLATELPTVQVKDLNDTVGNLLARGVPAAELVDTFKMFAIVTGATGGNMKGLTKAYTDTMGKGKLAGQEFNQFINASVPIRKALVDFFGGKKTINDLIVMQKKGQITFEVLREALKGLTVEGGQFETIMGKKADLLWGRYQKFSDLLYYLKAELGKKFEVPLKVVLGVMNQIVDTVRKLDGNWKRFIIIGLGVTAIVGPLLVVYGLLKSFMGPIGYVTAAIGIISLLIDDIYVWVKDGDSVMGALFGDYAQYKPQIEELKTTLLNLFTNLKNLIKDVLVDVIELFAWLTGKKKNEELSALNNFLWVLTKISQTLSVVILGVRELFALLSKPFKSEEENKKTAKSLREDLEKNPITKRATGIGSSIANVQDMFSPKNNWMSAIIFGDLFQTIQGWKDMLSSGKNAMMTPSFAGVPQYSPLGSFAPTVNLTVNATGEKEQLGPTIKKVVQDSLENVARNIKNLSGK